MVVFENISVYNSAPPADGESRKIPNGPVYSFDDIQTAVKECVLFWTNKCKKDTTVLGFDTEDVAEMLLALSSSDYRDSEWCSASDGIKLAACDAYVISRREYRNYKYENVRYYLKFGIKKNGGIMLVASCHWSG